MLVAVDAVLDFAIRLVECAKECADARHCRLWLFRHHDHLDGILLDIVAPAAGQMAEEKNELSSRPVVRLRH